MPPKSASRGRADAGQFKSMQRAYYEARFSEAAAEYDASRSSDPAAALLRARISLKMEDCPAAIKLLSSLSVRGRKDLEAERMMLLAKAYSRSNLFEEADEYFDRAEQSGAPELFPVEFPYLRGRRFLEERQPKNARLDLTAIRALDSAEARVLGDLLETGILSHEEHYRNEAHLLVDLLKFIDRKGGLFFEESMHAIRTLAMLARELDDPDVRDFAVTRVVKQEWSGDFRVHQFQALKAIGWCHALQGDYFNGLRYLKMAEKIAPSNAWHAIALLDRAYLARCIGEARWSRDELVEADDLLARIEWRETKDEQRVALILAAELHAPLDAGKGAAYLAEFSELRDSISPLLLFRYDHRLNALEDYAAGIVQAQLGNARAAIAKLRRSWEIYDQIEYDWRAGKVALRLHELTGSPEWHERAQQKLRGYAKSWLGDELRSGPADRGPRVTPSQLAILRLLCEGKTTPEIIAQTGRTLNTIQNHIKALMKAYGVPNRSVLVAEATRRGLPENA